VVTWEGSITYIRGVRAYSNFKSTFFALMSRFVALAVWPFFTEAELSALGTPLLWGVVMILVGIGGFELASQIRGRFGSVSGSELYILQVALGVQP
jgi:FtsH-binding integral membrane protein